MIFDIKNISKYKENHQLEAKKAQKGLPNSFWETYSSFANSDGGFIVLGAIENDKHNLVINGVEDSHQIVSDIWNTVNNPQKVSVNVLTDPMVAIQNIDGKEIVVVEVPRAERGLRPVYIGQNPINGTYKRNGEGDYHCNKEQLALLFRDASETTVDTKVLDEMGFDVFDNDTIQSYRNNFAVKHQNHIWNSYDNELFLRKIGAIGASSKDQRFHPTVAGLLMFGQESEIVREFPHYFLDYREVLDTNTRWNHRIVSSSGDWSGNLFDFFFRIFSRLTQDIPVPFALENGLSRIDDTSSHLAIRELLLNCLVHADHYGRQGIVVIKGKDQISISNPGDFRIGLPTALEGGISDPRNSIVMKMFSLIDIGERAGSGLTNAIAVLANEQNALVDYEETHNPERTTVRINFGASDKQAINSNASDKTSGKRAINSKTSDKQAINDIYSQIIEYISSRQSAKTIEIAVLLKLSNPRARVYLSELVKQGKLIAKGNNKNRTYWIK